MSNRGIQEYPTTASPPPPPPIASTTISSEPKKSCTSQMIVSRMGSNLGPFIPSSLFSTIQMKEATHLNLHSNNIKSLQIIHDSNDSGMKPLSTQSLPTLRELDISSNLLDNCTDTTAIVVDQHLQQLGKSTPAGSIREGSLLYQSPNLVYLNLSTNNLTNASLATLLQGAQALHHLKNIDLSHNNITQFPYYELKRCCPNLETLDFLNNCIKTINDLYCATSHGSSSMDNGDIQRHDPSFLHSKSLEPVDNSINVSVGSPLATLNLQDSFGNDANPVCKIHQYRYNLICIMPHLINLDGSNVTEKERVDAQQQLLTGYLHHQREEEEDDIGCKTKDVMKCGKKAKKRKPGLVKSQKESSKRLSTVGNQSNKSLTVDKKTKPLIPTKSDSTGDSSQSHNSKENKFERRANTLSYHKLNSLETQVRTLSSLAEEQVEATQKLLHMHSKPDKVNKASRDIDSLASVYSNNEQSDSDYYEECEDVKSKRSKKGRKRKPRVKDKSHVPCVSDVNLQTSFAVDENRERDDDSDNQSGPIPSPPVSTYRQPTRPRNHQEIAQKHRFTTLMVAYQRWKIQKLMNDLSESNKKWDLLCQEKVKKAVDAERVHFDDHKEKSVLELKNAHQLASSLDEQVTSLRNQLSKAKSDIGELKEEGSGATVQYQKEIQKLRDDMTRADEVIRLCHKKMKGYDAKDAKMKKKVQDYKSFLKRERSDMKCLAQELEKTQGKMKEMEDKLGEKEQVKDKVKGALEMTVKRASIDRAKYEKIQSDAADMEKKFKECKDELQTMKVELEQEQSKTQSLNNNIAEFSTRQKNLEQELQQLKIEKSTASSHKDADLEKHKLRIQSLEEELLKKDEVPQSLKQSLAKVENERDIANKECIRLREKLESLESENKVNQMDKIRCQLKSALEEVDELRKESGKKSKYQRREVRDLQSIIKELECELVECKHKMKSMTRDVSSFKDICEDKIRREDHLLMENMKIAFENQLQSIEGELRKVVKERNKLVRSRDQVENDLENAVKELKAEKEIKSELESKVKIYESEMSQQKAKTETALKDLCKSLALT